MLSQTSRRRLNECNELLARVVDDVDDVYPHTIQVVSTYRGEREQDELFDNGFSKLWFPDSLHNATDVTGNPSSDAIDLAPVINGRIDWSDSHSFAVLAGFMYCAAIQRGIVLRWGGDWDGDGRTVDQSFMDWGHFELLSIEGGA